LKEIAGDNILIAFNITTYIWCKNVQCNYQHGGSKKYRY